MAAHPTLDVVKKISPIMHCAHPGDSVASVVDEPIRWTSQTYGDGSGVCETIADCGARRESGPALRPIRNTWARAYQMLHLWPRIPNTRWVCVDHWLQHAGHQQTHHQQLRD